MNDKVIKKINEILNKNAKNSLTNRGLSITELVKISKSSRSSVRTALAELKGAGKVKIRQIGMAKIYFLKEK